MSGIKAKLKTFINPFLNHPVCLTNTILIAVIAGFEQAWEDINLKCPESSELWWNQVYSLMFFFAPAVALCLLGILGSNMAWRLCQGLKYRGREHNDWGCDNCCAIFLRSLLVPSAWTFVALMDGDFYICFKYLPSCQEGLEDGVNCIRNATAWNHEKKGESQLIAWGFLLVCLVFGTCVVFCGRYQSKRTYFPHLYFTNLKKGERKLLEEKLMKQAKEDCERNVGALMMEFASNKTSLSVKEWESICSERTKQERKDGQPVTTNRTEQERKDGQPDTTNRTEQERKDGQPVTTNRTEQERKDGQPVTKKQGQFYTPLSEFLEERPEILKAFDKAKADAESKKNKATPTTNPLPKPSTTNPLPKPQLQPSTSNTSAPAATQGE